MELVVVGKSTSTTSVVRSSCQVMIKKRLHLIHQQGLTTVRSPQMEARRDKQNTHFSVNTRVIRWVCGKRQRKTYEERSANDPTMRIRCDGSAIVEYGAQTNFRNVGAELHVIIADRPRSTSKSDGDV